MLYRAPCHRNHRSRLRRLSLESLEHRRPLAVDLTVLDVNTVNNALTVVSSPVSFGGLGYFYASDNQNGLGLWKTDGTSAGTTRVKDLDLPSDSKDVLSNNISMLAAGTSLYFVAASPGPDAGTGLWKTNGTVAGTVLVGAFSGQSPQAVPRSLVNVGSLVYFSVAAGVYKTDGLGVQLVDDATEAYALTNVGGSLYYAQDNSVWQIRPDVATPFAVVSPNSLFGRPSDLLNVNGSLYFTAYHTVLNQHMLLKFNNTEGRVTLGQLGAVLQTPVELENVSGTVYIGSHGKLRKLNASGDIQTLADNFSSITELTNVSGKLYFRGTTQASGTELWKSTSAGTMVVKEIAPGAESAAVARLVNVSGTLYFSTLADGVSSIWKSNGTPQGTALVKELEYTLSTVPMANVGGSLYFAIKADGLPSVLWRSNGTEVGTVQVKDITTASSNAASPVAVGDKLFFTALEGSFATELWVSDGTQEGLNKLDVNSSGGSEPAYLTNVNGTLFFAATTQANGTELWRSNGTQQGTVIVSDLVRGSASALPRDLINVGGTLYFTIQTSLGGRELWRLNRGVPTLVRDIRPGAASSGIANMVNVGARLYFTANDGTNGVELWTSDGTAAGTVMLKNIASGVASSSPQSLTVVGNTVYFRATDAAGGSELWKTNGTSSGTVMVRDIVAGANGSTPSNLVNVGGLLYFSANDGVNGAELWRSNGTSLGTSRVSDIALGRSSSNPGELTNVQGTLYFKATDSNADTELWQFANNIASRVRNIHLTSSSNPSQLRNVNGVLYFAASDGTTGNELWRSNGAQTERMIDNVVGFGNGNPTSLTPFGQQLAFVSTSTLFGRELFLYDPLRGAASDDTWRVVPESIAGANVLSVYLSANRGRNRLLARYAPTASLKFDGLEGFDTLHVTSDQFSVDQAGVQVLNARLDGTAVELRQLSAAMGPTTFRFDADSSLGTYELLTPLATNAATLDFSPTSTAVSIDLASDTLQEVNGNLSVRLVTSSNVVSVVGGDGADVILGNAAANILSGGAGDDLLQGRDGDDVLNGEAGNDLLQGDEGSDTLVGHTGNDRYLFGDAVVAQSDSINELANEGRDRVDFQSVTTSVSFDLGLVTGQATSTNRILQLSAADTLEDLFGGSANDVLIGNDLSNVLNGRQGNDSLLGELGDDVYSFDTALAVQLDTLTELPGGGLDTLDFSNLSTAISVDLGIATNQVNDANQSIKLSYSNTFENAIGGSGADTLRGNALANVLVGNGGADTLYGLAKRDLLIGGTGSDTIFGGADEDILIASTSTHDAVFANLNQLLTAWTSTDSYVTRIAALKAGVGPDALTLLAGQSVTADSDALDQLSGESSLDWFFRSLDDAILDLNGEVIEQL